MKKAGLFLFLFQFLFSFLYGADTLVLNDKNTRDLVIGNNFYEVFEDTSAALTIENILRAGDKIRFSAPEFNFNKNRDAAYWIRFTVKSTANPSIHYLLENYYLHTTDMQLFYVSENKIHSQRTGEAITYSQRDYRHKNLMMDIPMPEGQATRVFYIRIHSKLYTDFNFRIKNQRYFTYYTINEYILLGIYYGILVIMALYNLILFFTIRSRIYLFYIFYVLAGILVSLNEDKLGYQYLWPENPEMNPILAYFIAPMLLMSAFMLYSSEFLELRKRAPKLFRVCWVLFGVYTFVFMLNFFYPVELILRVLYVFPFLSVFVAAIYVYLKGYTSARFFIAGATLILVSIILIQLRAENILSGTLFTVYILNYSLIAETVILSIALSDKIKLIQKEKETAQQEVIRELEENKKLQGLVNLQLKEKQTLQEKVNKELETKVNERTMELKRKTEELEKKSEELAVSNSKLQSLIDQANKMNIKLDLDNWELKKNVQHELVQRITGQEVSFEVFQTVFKDDLTCMRFLDELKWSGGYECKKCGYNKFKEMDNTMVRKCSRCSYPESVTSGTLLHGIKFPINSALYLVYLIHKRRGKVKLEDISAIAGVSIVSASKFKSKIMDKLALLEKEKKGLTWEEIVF